MPVNPRYRPLVLFLAGFALMAPYLAVARYYAFHYPAGHRPSWALNMLLIWFLANFLVLTALVRRTFRKSVVDANKTAVTATKDRAVSIGLATVWSLFFLYGLKQAVEGHFPLSRAIPAGLTLLIFIAVFGWSAHTLGAGAGPRDVVPGVSGEGRGHPRHPRPRHLQRKAFR